MKAIVKISQTKSGKTRIIDIETGRKMDKCAMSFFFHAYEVYAIYWDTIPYERMCNAFLQLPNVTIINQ